MFLVLLWVIFERSLMLREVVFRMDVDSGFLRDLMMLYLLFGKRLVEDFMLFWEMFRVKLEVRDDFREVLFTEFLFESSVIIGNFAANFSSFCFALFFDVRLLVYHFASLFDQFMVLSS
jgi:hypothetical protein